MKTVIIGSSGMLGHDVWCRLRNNIIFNGHLIDDSPFEDVLSPSHAELDISNEGDVFKYLNSASALGYDTVINCAAATDVAGIEESRDMSHRSYEMNALAPKYLAEACSRNGMKLYHFSTDYVYSEKSFSHGGVEFPKNTYGMHKLIGENFIRETMKGGNYCILRIGCLYGAHNEKSFLHKFLRNACASVSEGRNPVVMDYQTSTPTSTDFVVQVLLEMIRNEKTGTFCVSPSGSATRYAFAGEIIESIKRIGFLPNEFSDITIERTFEHPSHLPANSTMSQINPRIHVGLIGETWVDRLNAFVEKHNVHIREFMHKELTRHGTDKDGN